MKTNPAARCPACQTTLSGAVALTPIDTPREGDISVCAYCTVYLVFNADLTLRLMPDDEFEALPLYERLGLHMARAHFLERRLEH